MGRSGTRALAYANADDRTAYTIPSAEVKLKPDTVYRFGAWVKTENLTSGGDGAIVCVEWYDGARYVGGAYSEGVKGTTADWVKVEGLTPRIPTNVTAAADFTRRAAPPARKVWIDAAGRTIVDGMPYFPLGTFWTEFTSKEDVELYAKSPFNCLMPYWGHRNPDLRALFDLCAEKGIHVIPNLKDFWDYGDPKTSPARPTDFVNAIKDHPAVLAWYVVDESPLSKLPQLCARRELVARLDPDHLTWGCFYQSDQILDYLPSCDVIGTDPYPIGQTAIDMVSVSTRLYSLPDYEALLVVNASPDAQTVSVPWKGLAFRALMGETPASENGALKLSLKGLDCALIRLDRNTTANKNSTSNNTSKGTQP